MYSFPPTSAGEAMTPFWMWRGNILISELLSFLLTSGPPSKTLGTQQDDHLSPTLLPGLKPLCRGDTGAIRIESAQRASDGNMQRGACSHQSMSMNFCSQDPYVAGDGFRHHRNKRIKGRPWSWRRLGNCDTGRGATSKTHLAVVGALLLALP